MKRTRAIWLAILATGLSMTAAASTPLELSQATAKAIMAENDEDALQACQEPKPVDYEWVLNTCMKLRLDGIEQAEEMKARNSDFPSNQVQLIQLKN